MTSAPTPSRRDVIKGRLGAVHGRETHVWSLLIHVRPEGMGRVVAELESLPGLEIHLRQGAKLVLTLETESEADIVGRLNDISLLHGVLSAALVFHHFEPSSQGNDD